MNCFQVKIADFGLVTATDDEDARLAIMSDNMFSLNGGHTNQVGTSLYMSPELMMGKSYNEKIDVYSLGLIFFELLSPFTTEMERIVNITEAKKFNFGWGSSAPLDAER
jgi:eukaryotic translation initiation factor 2-alpha kinase 3